MQTVAEFHCQATVVDINGVFKIIIQSYVFTFTETNSEVFSGIQFELVAHVGRSDLDSLMLVAVLLN